jgi:hypothetical protein
MQAQLLCFWDLLMANAVIPDEHQGEYRMRSTELLAIMAVSVIEGMVFGATLCCTVLKH